MSARLPRWLPLLAIVLSARAALGADPLPEGALARFGTPGGTFPGYFYQPILVTPDGVSSSGEALSPDGRLRARFGDAHEVKLTRAAGAEEVRLLKGHTA